MKKQVLSILLAVALLFTGPVSKSHASAKYNHFEYEILADGTVEILRYIQPSYDETHLVIPETIEGYTVTSIGSQAFSNCKSTTIVMPDTITVIKRSAFFSCNNLTSIKLSKNLKTIEDYAFYGNRNLERIVFPDGLIEIGEKCFQSCVKIDSITVPNSLQTVEWMAFSGCNAIDNVYYKSTKEDWKALEFFKSNVANQAVIHYDFNSQPGDINSDGAKNMLDAMYLYAWVSGQKDLTPISLMLADLNCDARVNMLDSFELYQNISGA